MEEETLRALEGSITKWDLICQGLGLDRGSYNCPLCQLLPACDCEGCPVAQRSKSTSCGRTPYMKVLLPAGITLPDFILSSEYHDSCFEGDLLIESVENELVYLLECLPEGHPWREQI